MIPGEMNLPVASTTSAPEGTATSAPSAAILPSRRTIVPFGIVPRVTVRMVPPLIATTDGGDWPESDASAAAERTRTPMARRREITVMPPVESPASGAGKSYFLVGPHPHSLMPRPSTLLRTTLSLSKGRTLRAFALACWHGRGRYGWAVDRLDALKKY